VSLELRRAGGIIDAINQFTADPDKPQTVGRKILCRYLYTGDMPDVDLLIRTANEMRLSNYLLWQTAYSEFYFTDVLWPDFGKKDIEKALIDYSRRTAVSADYKRCNA